MKTYGLLYVLTAFMLMNAIFVAYNTWVLLKYRSKIKERDNYYNKTISEIRNSQKELFDRLSDILEKLDKIIKTNESIYH